MADDNEWALFAARLAKVLERLTGGTDMVALIVSDRDDPDAFTQYACGGGGLIAEASNARFVKKRGMSRHEKKELRRVAARRPISSDSWAGRLLLIGQPELVVCVVR